MTTYWEINTIPKKRFLTEERLLRVLAIRRSQWELKQISEKNITAMKFEKLVNKDRK